MTKRETVKRDRGIGEGFYDPIRRSPYRNDQSDASDRSIRFLAHFQTIAVAVHPEVPTIARSTEKPIYRELFLNPAPLFKTKLALEDHSSLEIGLHRPPF